MTGSQARPRIRHNDYGPLTPPPLGGWTPKLTVSVVIPAHGGQHRLDLALAALSAQTYPAALTEVVVVDDGSRPPLRLPEIRPDNTRLISADPGGCGPGHAVNCGVRSCDGAVIQRLDADMLVYRDHLEALMRWHHLTDYLVAIGAKRFVEEPQVTAEEVRDAVRHDAVGDLVDLSQAVPSTTEETIHRLDGLRRSKNPYHVCTGPTLSLHRTLFEAAGGFDPLVLRGEDTEFGYRLAQRGAVFVPDMRARSVHLGLPTQRRDRSATVRMVEPFLAHRIPLRRDLRRERGRTWLVPYVEAVFHVGEATEHKVRAAVTAALSGTLPDVSVTLVAPWSAVPDGRPGALHGAAFELRTLREGYRHDPRVRLVENLPPSAAPVPFRYVGPVDVPLGPSSLEGMVKRAGEERLGLLEITFGHGRTARLERTEAVGRALLLTSPGEPPDRVIEQTHGIGRAPAAAFWPAAGPAQAAPAPPQRTRRRGPLRRCLSRLRRTG